MFPISEGGMREKIIRCCLIVVLALAAFPAEAQANDRQLDIGQILVLSPEAPVAAVVVGNPEVVDVAVQGDKSVLVFGRSMPLALAAKGARDQSVTAIKEHLADCFPASL